MSAGHRRSCLAHTASPLSPQGPKHIRGRAHTVTHTQSSDSSGKKEAHSHSNCTRPGVALGDPSNSPFIHLVLKPLQPPLSFWAPRVEMKTDRRKLVEKVCTEIWAEWGEEKMGLGLHVLEVNLAACGYEATCCQLH